MTDSGLDGDMLPEERERETLIPLWFQWLLVAGVSSAFWITMIFSAVQTAHQDCDRRVMRAHDEGFSRGFARCEAEYRER